MGRKPSTGASTRSRPWSSKSNCRADHEGARARQPVLAADGGHPTRAERERSLAIQFGVVRHDWAYGQIVTSETVELVGGRAAVVPQLLHSADNQTGTNAVRKVLERHDVEGEQRRILIISCCIPGVELHTQHGVDLETPFWKNPRVRDLGNECPVVQARVSERVRIVLTRRGPDIETERDMIDLGDVVPGNDRREVKIK